MEINWAGAIVIGIIAVIYLLRKMKSTKGMKKIGASTEGLFLFSQLKNDVISLPENEKVIFKTLLHDLVMAENNEQKITYLRNAADELEKLTKEATEAI